MLLIVVLHYVPIKEHISGVIKAKHYTLKVSLVIINKVKVVGIVLFLFFFVIFHIQDGTII